MLRTVINTLIIASIIAILYFVVGQSYVKFYSGGRAEILEVAAKINELCHTNKSCPVALEGWQALNMDRGSLRNGSMFYYPVLGRKIGESEERKDYQEFTLIYSFFAPDNWFEVQGGVGKKVTSGWKSR